MLAGKANCFLNQFSQFQWITSVILVAIGPSEFLMIPLLSEFFGSYFVRNESFHKCDELLLVWKESDWWKQWFVLEHVRNIVFVNPLNASVAHI